MLSEQIAVTLLVADALEALGVLYAIGGSFASALHGVMRTTMDVDLLAELSLVQTERLASLLGGAFYLDLDTVGDAVRQCSSFNLIHLETLFKVDVFVARPREFDRAHLARRQSYLLSEEPERRACQILSTVVGCPSEREGFWSDWRHRIDAWHPRYSNSALRHRLDPC